MNTKNTTKYTLAGLGLTMGLAVAAAAAPALAAPTTPEPISAQVTKATSSSRQTSSEVSVEGTWQTPRLTVGSTLTVGSVDGGFNWRANFPFTLDDGTKIGECVADQAQLICTVTEVPEAWAAKENVTGTFHARASLVDKAVGRIDQHHPQRRDRPHPRVGRQGRHRHLQQRLRGACAF